MPTVEVFTKERMQAIEDEAIVDARIQAVGEQRQLILIKNNEEEVNVGDVRGPIGPTPSLPTIPDELNWKTKSKVAGIDPPGGNGVPSLKIQSGTEVVSTNLDGRVAIMFPEIFQGVSAVFCQVGDASSPWYTHINGTLYHPPSSQTVDYANLNVVVEGYLEHAFHVTVCIAGNVDDAFGVPLPGGRITCQNLRLNWLAIGW